MKETTLILLTNSYPFGTAESFLENEISYLSDSYNKTIIIATGVVSNNIKQRKTPANVIIEKIDIGNKNFDRARLIFRGIQYLFSQEEDFIMDKKAVKGSIKRKIFGLYFKAKSESNYKLIVELLKRNNIFPSTRSIIYSYWLFDTAHAAVNLKKNYFEKSASIAVSRAHGYDLYEDRNSIDYIPFRRYILKNIDQVFCCSENGMEYLRHKYPEYKGVVNCSKLGTMDYGVSPEINGKVFKILSCSNVIPLKRLHLIIEALSLLKNKSIEIKWTHIGDGPLLNRIRKLADEELGGNLHYEFQGHLPYESVVKYYQDNKVDVFLNVSDSEGLPVSIMEAISFGIPVIATNVGGTAEIVVDKYNGFLLDKNFEADKLAELITMIASMDDQQYIKLQKNARHKWESEYYAEKNYLAFIDDLRNLSNS